MERRATYTQSYTRGKPTGKLKKVGKTDKTGTKVSFRPDPDIFEEQEFSFDTLSGRLRELAFLNRGLHIRMVDEREDRERDFRYAGGIVEFVQSLNRNKNTLHDPL